MQVIDWRGKPGLPVLDRASQDSSSVLNTVIELVEEVKSSGVAAIKAQTARFDGVELSEIRVTDVEIENALLSLPEDLKAAITEAIRRVRIASRAQLPKETSVVFDDDSSVTTRWVPLNRAGLYVPGGKATYPSSLIMNVVPAQEANVGHIALATPAPVNDVVLATAALLGVTEIYKMGGAGAVAALAYGLPEIGLEPVDIITGPGNVYVSTAKRIVSDIVAIDSEAGPSEVLIVADSSANPEFVAADLLSQAEHDENAVSILVTTEASLADRVQSSLEIRLSKTKNSERAKKALHGPQSAIVIVDDLETAVDLANAYASEHTEVHTEEAHQVALKIENAGAVFVGDYSPVSLGDYLAGSNHVLPTSGTARYRSGLNTSTFLKSQQLIEYPKRGLAGVAELVEVFSEYENLPAHGEAVIARFDEKLTEKEEGD
ncbi:MAG: histidinol dehydrogenase [Microbacteriaceae bacterium]|nr:histidinol dehydrogenase [Microbacteriaceae bacterium]